MFNKDDLNTLMTATAAPAVSIYLPTHVAGRPIQQDSIRMRNLLAAAEERLTGMGLRRPDALAILAPGMALLDDDQFWRHQQHGLAVFLAPDTFHCFRVPLEMPEEVVVGPRFHLRHLQPLLAADGMFLVLTISAGRTRLFEATRHAMIERDDLDLPKSVEDLAAETDYQNMLHANPVARPRSNRPSGVPKTHNFGEDPEELRKALFIEYLHRIEVRMRDHLSGVRTPLVLIAQPEVQGHFEPMGNLAQNLVSESVRVQENPDALSEEELHRLAYERVRPILDESRRAALEQLRSLVGDNDQRATTRPDEIVRAARFARIDKLLLAKGEHVWGRYDADADKVLIHGSPGNDDVDLLDEAAAFTLQQGGSVHIVPKDELPQGAIAGAVMRF